MNDQFKRLRYNELIDLEQRDAGLDGSVEIDSIKYRLAVGEDLNPEETNALIEDLVRRDLAIDNEAFVIATSLLRVQMEKAKYRKPEPTLSQEIDLGSSSVPPRRLNIEEQQLYAIHSLALRQRIGLNRYPNIDTKK